MTFDPQHFPKAMAAVLKRARNYLQDEIHLGIDRTKSSTGSVNTLNLRAITAVVCTGGPIRLIIAFSFDRRVLERLREVATRDFVVEPHEHELFLRETAAEVTNFILGHATADLEEEGCHVTLSSPVVIDASRRIHRPKKAMFATLELRTAFGIIDMDFIGPPDMFDQHLNVLS